MATVNMYRKFCEVWSCGFWDMLTQRHTDRQTCQSQYFTHLQGGQSNEQSWKCKFRKLINTKLSANYMTTTFSMSDSNNRSWKHCSSFIFLTCHKCVRFWHMVRSASSFCEICGTVDCMSVLASDMTAGTEPPEYHTTSHPTCCMLAMQTSNLM